MTHVLVAGGGPVGLACAIEARMAGCQATVVEPRVGIIDKACGEGIMPGGVAALARLGVEPRGFPLRGVEYRDGRRAAQHRFAAGPALGVRRTTLHAALRDRAEQLGVRVVQGRVDAVAQDAGGVTAAGIRADWLLGADGLHSTVARATGLHAGTPRPRRRYGLRRHFAIEPWSELIEVHWTPLGELYVTPTGDGVVGIASLARRGVDFEEAIAAAPELAARLRGAEPRSELRGAGPFRQRTRARVVGRVLLVGDASGYVDALTGEGIRIGVAQARAAVDAIGRNDPSSYERAWREVTRDVRRLTGGLVRLAASPARGLVVPTASALPGVFAAAVERLAR
ncbi:NAD(P)/FAD-dependent oxidoreductase [Lysinimonas soli]|uniref:NAD(P)/FAD-dependent oxidoreductase n=1 Tax=Lysinimonas soli TaxID=1074233 RepID=A0ABW0NQT8_9MICO